MITRAFNVKLTHHKNAKNKRVDVGRLLFGGASVQVLLCGSLRRVTRY